MEKNIWRNFILFLLLVALLVATAVLSLSAYRDKFIVVEPTITVKNFDEVIPQNFSIEDSIITISYSDGRVENIKINGGMLDAADLEKLNEPGRHTVTIYYDEEKSVQTEILLLRSIDSHDLILDKIVQGLQKSAPKDNINGEFDASFYYQIPGSERKEYRLSLKFTLDIDQKGGGENYLELAVFDDSGLLMGVFYKDNPHPQQAPYFYIKLDARELGWWMGPWEGKYSTASIDSYLGSASFPNEDNLWTFDPLLSKLVSYVSDQNTEILIKLVLSMLLTDAQLADDGSCASLTLDFSEITKWLALAPLLPNVSSTTNDILAAMGADVDFNDFFNNITSAVNPRLKINFASDGAMEKLAIIDEFESKNVSDILQVNIGGKLIAGINLNKVTLKNDDTSFSLPTDLGIEEWEEGSVKGVESFWEESTLNPEEDRTISLERWMMLQYRKMMGGPPSTTWYDEIERYENVPYTESGKEGNRFNMMDIYRPRSEEGNKLPVIVSIHGGGWVNGNKEFNHIYCQELALEGFVVLNINYHLLPVAQMPVPMQDFFAVFNFIMDAENAQKYGFDIENVFLTGDSAGGHYAMLTLSVLADPELREAFDVETQLKINAASVSSTGFSFSEYLELPIPFAHFFVNQFFTDDLPYTAYRDNPEYIKMAKALNIENNKIEDFPPMFVSTAHADMVLSHSQTLRAELIAHGVEHIYDYRNQRDKDNPENYVLGHNFNVARPDFTVSKAVNKAMCDFFKSHMK